MSKKDEITELLSEGYSVKDIMDELDVSRSYVQNIKSKTKKLEGDSKGSNESENSDMDNGNEHSTSGNSSKMDGSTKNMEEKHTDSKTNKSGSVGGIKKVKKHGKQQNKETKEDKEDKGEEKTSKEDSRWNQLKKQGTKILLGLILSILLMLGMLKLSNQRTEKPPTQKQRFPMQGKLPVR